MAEIDREMMTDFERKLRDRLDDKSTSIEVLDQLYNDYVKYVGKLDALPREQLTKEDIKTIDGKVMAFSRWPTKSTRALAKKMWDQYNLNVQSGTPTSDEIESDPCEDPNFLSNLMNTCVRTSMRMGANRYLALKHCTQQVEKMAQAIRAACHGRGLVPDKQKEFLDNTLEVLGQVIGKPVKLTDLAPEDRALLTDLVNSLGYQKPRDF